MNRLEKLYAKIVYRLNIEKRLAVARKLVSLLRNNFTLMEALNRLEMVASKGGKKPHEPMAIVLREWQKNLERGMSFSEAISKWAPQNSTLLLASGNVSNLIVALENLINVIEGTERIKRAMRKAVMYPLFLLVLTFGIIVMVGVYLVPPLASVAGNDIVWTGAASSLIWLSNFTATYWHIFAFAFFMVIVIVWMSLANWSGRIRALFDNLPPWNVYKIQVSVGWLMSLAAMLRAGVMLPDAMRMLSDSANKYLHSILERTLGFIANGDNLGVALEHTGRDFPNEEIIGDLTIYSDMNDFDKNLTQIANDYMNESVRKMESLSETMNSLGILLVSAIIAWVVLGTFQMQDQITSALS